MPRDEAEYNKLAVEIHNRLEIEDTVDQADIRRQYLEYTIKKMASRSRTAIPSQDDDMGITDSLAAQEQRPPPTAPTPDAPMSIVSPGARDAWADMDHEESSSHFTDQAAGHGAAADHTGAMAGQAESKNLTQPTPTGRPEKLQPARPDEACTVGHEAHLLCDKCPPLLIQEAVDEARRRKAKGLEPFEIIHTKDCPCKLCEILSATPPASVTATPSNLPEIKSIATPPTPSSPKPRGRSASATRTHEENMAEEAEQDLKKQRTELEQDVTL